MRLHIRIPLALVLMACFGNGAFAAPMAASAARLDGPIIRVEGGCGPGGHRDHWGNCRPNYYPHPRPCPPYMHPTPYGCRPN
jgi:hypothetical protein